MTEKQEVLLLLKTYLTGQSWTLVSSYLINYHNDYYQKIQGNIKDNLQDVYDVITSRN